MAIPAVVVKFRDGSIKILSGESAVAMPGDAPSVIRATARLRAFRLLSRDAEAVAFELDMPRHNGPPRGPRGNRDSRLELARMNRQ